MINSRGKVRRLGKMDHHMKENTIMVKNKEEECLNGEMGICI